MGVQEKGSCQACGKDPRVLATLEDGRKVCRTCLRSLRPSRPKHLASENSISYLRKMGFNVPDDLSKIEGNRLLGINSLKWDGVIVPMDTPGEEVDRLQWISMARRKGIQVADSATKPEVEAAMERRDAVRHFYTRLAGVSFPNRDGSDRQAAIGHCHRLETLVLKHEPDNPKDPNAIKVLNSLGEQMGYLPAQLAKEVLNRSKYGYRYAVFPTGVQGGTSGMPFLGVSLLVVVVAPGHADAEAQEYLTKLQAEDERLSPRRFHESPEDESEEEELEDEEQETDLEESVSLVHVPRSPFPSPPSALPGTSSIPGPATSPAPSPRVQPKVQLAPERKEGAGCLTILILAVGIPLTTSVLVLLAIR